MRVKIIAISIFFGISSLMGQSDYDCKEILKKEIVLDNITNNIEEFHTDMQTFMHCEFDSIDFHIFWGPQGNFPFLSTALIEFRSQSASSNKKFTFNDFKTIINDYKQKEVYLQFRTVIEAEHELMQKNASIEHWEYDKQLLTKMEFPEEHLENMHAIISLNENKPYQEIFLIFSDTLEARKNRLKTESSIKLGALKKENPELKKLIDGLYAYDNYEVGLTKAKKYNKYILLYFNGYGCVNAREIERIILSEIEIQNYINDHLIFVNLLVDDKTRLQENQIYISEYSGKEINTIAKKNLDLQISLLHTNAQPAFAIINTEEKIISSIYYTRDKDEFKAFLEQNQPQQ